LSSAAGGKAASAGLHECSVAERIRVASTERDVVAAGVLADVSGSVPLALFVNVTVAAGDVGVSGFAALEALSIGRIGHAHGGGIAVRHRRDGRTSFSTSLSLLVPLAGTVCRADVRGLTAEAAASEAGSLGGVEVADGRAHAFALSEGVVGTDEDLGARS
jgi:hypothetical protein